MKDARKMDATRFDEQVHAWIDGELSPDEDRAMEEWCAAHPEARERAELERAFEARIRSALLSGSDGRAFVADALRRTRPARPLQATRGFAAAASVLAAIAGFMWFNCVPPFECSYVGAMEAAATAPAVRAEPVSPDRMTAALRTIGTLGDMCERVDVAHCCGEGSARWRLRLPCGSPIAVVEGRCAHDAPSFRRRREAGGGVLWVAEKTADTIVCFRDPGSGGYVSLVGSVPSANLEQAALSLREALGR
ncbi:MAG: hypothetical protein HMLKMBBP_01285 [Planctomycetes bacterium]|nr:hypothetical protein [Planctomycetota bacterium]